MSVHYVVVATTREDGEQVHAAGTLPFAEAMFDAELRGGRYVLGSDNRLRVVSLAQWRGTQAIRRREAGR